MEQAIYCWLSVAAAYVIAHLPTLIPMRLPKFKLDDTKFLDWILWGGLAGLLLWAVGYWLAYLKDWAPNILIP